MARGRHPAGPPKRRPKRPATTTVDVTLRMPRELFDAARIRAAAEETPVGELLCELLAVILLPPVR
jgi:hypothetical protein